MAAFIWAKQNGDWIPVIVDSNGHLQVDALSCALPTGAATQATLADILTELFFKLETGDLSIEAATKYLNVVVKTCANPSNLDLAITALRNDIRGTSTKDFSTLEADIEAIYANQQIQLARSVTWIRKYDEASASSKILRTVTAGKTFYLVYADVRVDHYAAGIHQGGIYYRDENDANPGGILTLGCADAEESHGSSCGMPTPLAFPAGWDIYIGANSYTTTSGTIFGWEE